MEYSAYTTIVCDISAYLDIYSHKMDIWRIINNDMHLLSGETCIQNKIEMSFTKRLNEGEISYYVMDLEKRIIEYREKEKERRRQEEERQKIEVEKRYQKELEQEARKRWGY